MTFQHRLPLATVLISLFLICSCQTTSEEPFEGRYVAVLELDSTRVLITELLNGLETPWDINWSSDGWIWINEHKGTVSRLNPDTGEYQVLYEVPDVHFQRAQGLLSMALHPEFGENPYVWLHYVYQIDEDEFATRIVRYRFDGETLTDRTTIVDPLPGTRVHNGSRMVIGEDGMLWFGGGDVGLADLAQDLSVYHGKLLRMQPDGSIPEDNPIEGSRVWTYGHRNIQGITFGRGMLYISEHGPDNDDEINLIQKGRNYGWPDVHGFCESETEQAFCRDHDVAEPMIAFNPVVAPAGMVYYDHPSIPEWQHSLLLANLRIHAFRVLPLSEDGENIEDVRIFFQQTFGRLRDVTVSPDGRIFVATSNMDWYQTARPDIHREDLTIEGDRILMLQAMDEEMEKRWADVDNPVILRQNQVALYLGDSPIADNVGATERLYLTHCASCHQPDGSGLDAFAPGLVDSDLVNGSREDLISLILNGVTEHSDYEWAMPAFRNLDDEEVAAIATYLIINFSEEKEAVTPAQVAATRADRR